MNGIRKKLIDRSIFAISFLLMFSITLGYFPTNTLGQKASKRNKIKQEQSVLNSETSVITVSNLEDSEYLKNSGTQNIAPTAGIDQGLESEPNNTFMTANPLIGNQVKISGDVYPNADQDWYRFNANAGDRVYSAIMTTYSASASTDSQLRIFASDGVTLLEFDEDDGSLGTLSSTIAGTVIPSAGIYYIQVKHFSATNTLRPYDLYFRLQSGLPTPEVEPNDSAGTANPIPANGFVSGARDPALSTEVDYYSFSLNAGDTVYLGLDLDPERDNIQWNGRLGMALFGDADNQILVVDDGSAGSLANPLSEAFFMTVKTAGTYYAYVDSATAGTGGPTATYNLSVSVIPRRVVGTTCTTYVSTNVPQAIGPGAGLTSSTITVPATSDKISSVRVGINATHELMADMDVNLRSPAGNDNGLFNDIGSTATGGQTMMDIILDQYSAGVPFVFTAVRPIVLKPELNYRLDWFEGEDPSGLWTLDIRDDLTNTSGGTLTSWNLEVCSRPAPLGTLVYNEDFEGGMGGYTHSGAADEWEYGTPATIATTTTNPVAAFIGCNSGTNCWKTDLDNTYDVSSNQDLFSPNILLPNQNGSLVLSWAMKYQMESATFDHASVQIEEIGGLGAARTVWEWKGATMTVGVGSPTVNIGESAGWGIYNASISDFANLAGRTIRIKFHLDTDTSINFAGMGIDDVQLRFIPATAANVAVGGRVLTSNGSSISNARVTITDSNGVSRTTTTSTFGYYKFNNVEAGQDYNLTVNRKGYQFNPQFISVFEGIKDLNIVAQP